MPKKWRYTRWRYRRQQPRHRPHFAKSVVVSGATLIAGALLWITGFAWGVVLVVAGLVALVIVGFWGVRPTRGTDPNDGSQWPMANRGLISTDWPPPP